MKIKTKTEVIVAALRFTQVSNSLNRPRSFRRTELLADVLGNVLSNP